MNSKIFSPKFFLDDGKLVDEIDEIDFGFIRDKYTGDNNTSIAKGFLALVSSIKIVKPEVVVQNRVVVPVPYLFASFGEGLKQSEMKAVFVENLRDIINQQRRK